MKTWVIRLGGPGSGNHGHAGRPGKVGGSAPGFSKGAVVQINRPDPIRGYSSVSRRNLDQFGDDLRVTSALDDIAERNGVKRFYRDNHTFESEPEKQTVIAQGLAKELAKRYTLDEELVRETTAGWAGSLENPNSARIIETVSEKFGVPLTDIQAERISKLANTKSAGTFYSEMEGKDITIHPLSKADASRLVDRMYEGTQEYFRNSGITSVRLYRGAPHDDLPNAPGRGGSVKFNQGAVTSWSASKRIADEFREMYYPGATIGADIPVSRILSFPLTGIGSFSEGEFLVIGGQGEDTVIIAETD